MPPPHRETPQLVLSIGLDLPIPIPDLRVDEDGVFGTLSFGGAPYACSVPWSAVFAMVSDDGMGMHWKDDIPAEILAEIQRAQRPPLRAVDGGASDGHAESTSDANERDSGVDAADAERSASPERSADDGEREPGPTERRVPYLRLVK